MRQNNRETEAANECAAPVEGGLANDGVAWMPLGRKPRPNHQRTLSILRAMTPQQKLAQVFKLNERVLTLMRAGLKRRFPDLDEAALEKAYLKKRERCHNRNY